MERWEMKADDLVVTAKRSWGYRKWLVLRSLSQGIPFFESAPERERRGKERLGDGFEFGAYGTISSLFFFFFFFFLSLIQRRLTKQQGNIAGDGATLNSCSWSLLWLMAHCNYPYVSRSPHSFMFFIILLLFFSLFCVSSSSLFRSIWGFRGQHNNHGSRTWSR